MSQKLTNSEKTDMLFFQFGCFESVVPHCKKWDKMSHSTVRHSSGRPSSVGLGHHGADIVLSDLSNTLKDTRLTVDAALLLI